MSLETTLSESASIVIVGLRNAGKSSLVNALFAKEVSIVSPEAGTTTDPVTRKMELPGWGPVAFIDTAGIDDVGELGEKRVRLTEARLAGASAVILATPAHTPVDPRERELLERLKKSGKPFLAALTHADMVSSDTSAAGLEKRAWLAGVTAVSIDNRTGEGASALRLALKALAPAVAFEPSPLEGLVSEGDHLLLVVPIDLAAPKGRLIQPQIETIRDALDRDCAVTVVKERELYETYRSLPKKPKLVITDSQAFSKTAADIDPDQSLTSFSILFARKKGELVTLLAGLDALKTFKADARVFVLEACAHHRGADDIANVKIPRLFSRLVTPKAHFLTVRELPLDIDSSDIVIHCGACMMQAGAMKARLDELAARKVPVTNYGLFLAWANGLLPRAVECLPEYPR